VALGVTGAVVSYQFFIVRTALDIEVLPALGFVALDLVLSLGLQAIQDMMIAGS